LRRRGVENLNSITLPHLWLVTSRASSPRSPYPHSSSKYFNFKVNALNNLWYDHEMVGEDAFRVRFKKKKERKKDAPRLHHLPRAHAFIYLMWILFMKYSWLFIPVKYILTYPLFPCYKESTIYLLSKNNQFKFYKFYDH